MVLQGESIDFAVEFTGPGPKGAKLLADGELGATDKVHPVETEWTFNPTFEKPGEFSLQIIVEGPAAGEMEKLTSRDPELMESIEEVERANATWDVVVADPDELYQSDSERVKALTMDALSLYTVGELTLKSVRRLRKHLEKVSEETVEEVEHEMTTLDDFLDVREDTSADETEEDDP